MMNEKEAKEQAYIEICAALDAIQIAKNKIREAQKNSDLGLTGNLQVRLLQITKELQEHKETLEEEL